MRGRVSNPEAGPDLFDRMPFDVLPFERVAIARRQPIQHSLDEPAHFRASIGLDEVVLVGRFERFNGGPQVGLVVDERDVIGVAAVGAQVVHDLSPANLAQPGKNGRIPAEQSQFAHGFAQAGLHDLAGGLGIPAEPRQGKAVEPGEMPLEERIECSLIPGEHASDELGFVGQSAIHSEAGLLDWDEIASINQSLRVLASVAMQRGMRGAGLFLVCALSWAGIAEAVSLGQPLVQALEELRRSGLEVIFSSALIEPQLTVSVDPGAGTPEEIARRILAPYGLGLEAAQADNARTQVFSVVRLPGKPMPPPAVASKPAAAVAKPPETPSSQSAEVDIYASRYGVDQSQMGPQPSTDISRQNLEALPGLFQDAMRAVRYLPGVATSAISVRPHIRGGREDEVATYFDGVPLFEPYHYKDIQGLLGSLDPETVSRMDFFSGVFPARFGNRLSGVLDMQPRTWDGENYYALSQSVLYSEALTQGKLSSSPLQWLGAVRLGVVDFISDLLDRTNVDPDFLDAIGRVQYDLSDEMSVAAGYLVLDDDLKGNFNSSVGQKIPGTNLSSTEQARISYRDGTGWLGWTFTPTEDTTLHATLSRTERHTHRFGMLDRIGSADGSMEDTRHFGTTAFRLETSGRLSDRWGLVSGFEWYDYEAQYRYTANALFNPQLAAAFGRPTSLNTQTRLDLDGQAYGTYMSVLWGITPDLSADAGMRWDGERYGVEFRGNQVSPRLGLQYKYGPSTVLRASWGRLSQTQRPDELQVDDGDDLFHRAEFAMQTVVGLERQLSPQVQLHVEAFDKRIENPRPRYENLLDPIALLPEIEVDRVLIQASSARAVGTEASLRWQATQAWSGWVNYTWSEATDVINGVTVPRSWDQKHAATIGIAWRQAPWLWSSDATWHTGWGRNRLYAVSLAPPQLALLALNERKWPAYFSLDSRVTWVHPIRVGALELFGEVDNLTNHANPCCVDVQFAGNTSRPLLERTTSVWLPRFALVGATWKLP